MEKELKPKNRWYLIYVSMGIMVGSEKGGNYLVSLFNTMKRWYRKDNTSVLSLEKAFHSSRINTYKTSESKQTPRAINPEGRIRNVRQQQIRKFYYRNSY